MDKIQGSLHSGGKAPPSVEMTCVWSRSNFPLGGISRRLDAACI